MVMQDCMLRLWLIFQFLLPAICLDDYSQTSCPTRKTSKVVPKDKPLIINCKEETVIKFINANFGRNDNMRSPHKFAKEISGCNIQKEALDYLNDRCGSQTFCDLKVTKEEFRKPASCWAITEHLDVSYSCVPKICIDPSYNTTTSSDENTPSSANFDVRSEPEPGRVNTTLYFQRNMSEGTNMIYVFTVVASVLGSLVILILLLIALLLIKRFSIFSELKRRRKRHLEIDTSVGNASLQYDYTEMNVKSDKPSENAAVTKPSTQIKVSDFSYDVERKIDDQQISTNTTENEYDITNSCDRYPSNANTAFYGNNYKADDINENAYDTTYITDKNEDSNYDVHFIDDTYDVSGRFDRSNIANILIDDTYDHVINNQEQNKYDLH